MRSSASGRRSVSRIVSRQSAGRPPRKALALAAAAVVPGVAGLWLASPQVARGDILWVGPAGVPTDFNTPADWSTGTIPGTGDNADVNNGGIVTISASTSPNVSVNDLRAADTANSTGTYIQTGGSAQTNNGWLRLGDSAGAVGNYQFSGGTLTVTNGRFDIGENGTGIFNQSGGTLTVNGGPSEIGGLVGNGGSTATTVGLMNDTGGTYNSSGEIWVGENLADGTLNVNTAGTINLTNWLAIGRDSGTGVVNLGPGGAIIKTGNGNVTFAGTNNTLNQTGGTFTNTATQTWIGEGTTSFYNMSGGVSNLSEVELARNAGTTGTVNLTGGTMNAAVASGQFSVGYNATGTGILNVTGGTLNVGTSANASNGVLAVGQSGTGTLNLSGTGVINAVNVYAGQTASAKGVINATGGTLNAATISVSAEDVGGSGTATGTFNVSGTAAVNATSLYIGKSGAGAATYTQTGGTVSVSQFARGTTTGTVVANLNGGTLANNTGTDNPTFITGFHAGELSLNGVTINTGANNLGVTAPFSGTGFTKAGTGVLTLNGTNSSSGMTGTATIAAGTLRLAAPAAVISTASVVGFYPMTSVTASFNGVSNVVQDTNPGHNPSNSNDFTINGGTVTASTLAPPGTGHAGSLSYSNGGFLAPAYGQGQIPVPTGNSAYTVGAWINLSTAANNGSSGTTGNNGIDGIIGYGNFTNNTTNAFRTGYYGGANGITNYWFGDDGSGPNPNNSLTGNWHYVAATYDPTAGSATGGLGVRTLYVDGTVVDSEDPNQIHNAVNNNLYIGLTNFLINPPEYFSGNMADLIIGNTAFTPVQLAAAAASDNPFSLNTSGGQLSTTSSVAIAAGATFDLNGNNQTLAGLSGTGVVTLGAGTLTVNNTAASEFDGSISGTGGLTKSGTGTFSIGSPAGSLTLTGPVTVNAGTLAFLTANGSSGIQARTLAGGVVLNGGALTLPVAASTANRTLLVTSSVTFATNASSGAILGKLDLGNGDLDVKATTTATATATLASLTAAAASGFNKGLWNGNGLASASAAADSRHLTAVGVIQNATSIGGTTAIYSTFDGQAVTANDVLSRYTLYGDTNLDGVVNAADYSRIDAGFVQHLTGWQNGDFNYDGVVDGSDYTLIDNDFNQQTGGIAAPAVASGGIVHPAFSVAVGGVGSTAVPEPASLGLLALAAGAVFGRRRRH